MSFMPLATGRTEERATLCSFTHSSMKLCSVISGKEAEPPAEPRTTRDQSHAAADAPLMLSASAAAGRSLFKSDEPPEEGV